MGRGILGLMVAGIVVALALAGDGPLLVSSPANPLEGWTKLVLQGEKLWIATATSSIERWPGDAQNPAPMVRVTSDLRLFGNLKGGHRSWSELDSTGHSFVRWVEADPPRKSRAAERGKDGSVDMRRFRWPSGSTETAPQSWNLRDRRHLPPPPEILPKETCLGPIDPYGLLGRLQCLSQGSEKRVVLLTRDGWRQLTARRGPTQKQRRQLKDLDSGGTRTIELEVTRIDLTAAEGSGGPHVLGMTGPVSLWLDSTTGALLDIEGSFSNVPGKTRMSLTGFSRRAASRPLIPWPPPPPAILDGKPSSL